MGEDAPDGLSRASLTALRGAEFVIGASRHLGLLPEIEAEQIVWPVPFADGIARLLALRGRRVVALASGDPFWFGAGSSIARHLEPGEWAALPGVSTFSLVAARMGWPLERTECFGLHAAPMERLRPALAGGVRMIVLLRDGAAVQDLGTYLVGAGFDASQLSVFEAVGGPRERRVDVSVSDLFDKDFAHPVCAAVEVQGAGAVLPLASGRADDWFESDGQMTKRPVRALTLSALAPRLFEHLWDIGGGSGSIGIEWLLAHPSLSATVIEPRADRVGRITQNAARLGVDRLKVVEGMAPEALAGLAPPDVVFVGGGLTAELLHWLEAKLPAGTRIVANAVTLESEAMLSAAQQRIGGDLLRIELAQSAPLGTRRGWKASYPVVQWSVTL
ncbi:precorrin-6Y C5,15-methyltransferase (decarboxylating) [Puniceibacterium sediminis]|uniref:Precorrin-6Y C5,15-methyltransferase (Decarboxylating) n=1 Tax=Puniceibacterium sediminis TaxID=1608407 RepID=A0A238WAI5_9RHOB|nr:precorrin-6Y C5,15-methyltransferase (decarboxylating) [Puniceibacterium sediminis]